jgi:hypothetical protein
MNNRLDKFIRDNREEFDDEEPSPRLWKTLEHTLLIPQKKRRFAGWHMARWAAAAGLVIAISVVAFFFVNRNNEKGIAGTGSPKNVSGSDRNTDILNEINPIYAKEVYHFTQLIELKQNELKQIGKDQPELYKEFMSDITQLDSSYNALQKQLPANPNREQLLEAMIQNLQLQTDLLNQQLRIINKLKKSKTSSDDDNFKNI